MPSLSKVVCLCAAPTPVAFSAGSIAAEPPPQRRRGVEERSGSCRPCRRCFSESASPSVSLPSPSLLSPSPPSEGRCSAASFSSVFALLLPRIVLPSKKRDTDTKWKRVKRQKQDGSDQVDRPLGDGLLRVDVLGFGGIGRVDSRIGST